jgi:2-polyprenyl-3-methyl-5-hydroxy-6-metoxy-1,4-benzoquinol methylase
MSTASEREEDLTRALREIRERVAARYPFVTAAGIALPDTSGIRAARGAAALKASAIGTVNPRHAGFLNNQIQRVKRLVARSFNWLLRDQVVYNLGVLETIDAITEAIHEQNRALTNSSSLFQARIQALDQAAAEMRDLRADWDKRFSQFEITQLRAIAELHQNFLRLLAENEQRLQGHLAARQDGAVQQMRELAAEQHRAFEAQLQLQHQLFTQRLTDQHADFTALQARDAAALQESLARHLQDRVAEERSALQAEIRQLRQRSHLFAHTTAQTPAAEVPAIDFGLFADKFRGPFEKIREQFREYVPLFAQSAPVLDLGCGRGEFLSLLRDAGVEARGVDLSADCILQCRQQGLSATQDDFFTALEALPPASLGGVFCSQVVEHLTPAQLPRLVSLAASRLRPGGRLLFETPNPGCLAIFATHFYLDPTHTRPVPPSLLSFYMSEGGMNQPEVIYRQPAAESLTGLDALPAEFREEFFGALDYAITAVKA